MSAARQEILVIQGREDVKMRSIGEGEVSTHQWVSATRKEVQSPTQQSAIL